MQLTLNSTTSAPRIQRSRMASANQLSALNVASTSVATAPAEGLLSVESAELLKGQKTVEIHHNGAVYRLQSTKLGKLILTK